MGNKCCIAKGCGSSEEFNLEKCTDDDLSQEYTCRITGSEFIDMLQKNKTRVKEYTRGNVKIAICTNCKNLENPS